MKSEFISAGNGRNRDTLKKYSMFYLRRVLKLENRTERVPFTHHLQKEF